jgi:hypothetical protein
MKAWGSPSSGGGYLFAKKDNQGCPRMSFHIMMSILVLVGLSEDMSGFDFFYVGICQSISGYVV